MAVERQVASKLHEPDALSQRRIYSIDRHIGIAVAGVHADARHLVEHARGEAESYRESWQKPMPVHLLVKRLSFYAFQYPLNGFYRPFGCSVLISGQNDQGKFELWMVEPSGVSYRYKAISIGKTRQAAKTELEKLDFDQINLEQAVKNAAKVIHGVRDENASANKDFIIDMSVIGTPTGGMHQFVSTQVKKEAEDWAKNELDSDSEEDEDEEM